jgi:ABC-type transporter Mla subunit MlaD
MELNETYLNERIHSLEQRLNQLQQQYNNAQQVLNQTQANINATVGALTDSKEMLAYLKQQGPEGTVELTEKVVEMKPVEAHDAEVVT